MNNPFRSTERSIPKGDSIEIYGTIFSPSERVFFDYFGQRMVEVCGEDVVFSVLSENDILLEEYKYADRDLPGKQLFKEFSWQHYEIPLGDLEFSRKYIWVFEIFQEDIQ